MDKDEEMSNTFVAEVGQKSAIVNNNEEIESLEPEEKEELFPEVKIDPPTGNEEIEVSQTKEEKDESSEMADEFIDNNKKDKKSKEKKGHPFLVFLIMLLCIGIGAGASYYYFEVYKDSDKSSDKKTIKEEPKVTTEQLQPTSRFIVKLIDKYGSGTLKSYDELYSKEKTMITDLSVDYAQKLAALNIMGVGFFTKADLQSSLDELFGKDKIKSDDKDIIIDDCEKLKYNDDRYLLYTETNCGGTTSFDVKTKIVKAEKNLETNVLTVNVAVAITDGNKVYKSYDVDAKTAKDEIATLTAETLNMDSDYTKFNQYKYTFNYDNDNNDYYLESIELEK